MIGNLTVICGCMFSGKSEELMRRMRRAQIKKKVACLKPKIDNRYSENSIASHAKSSFPSYSVTSGKEVLSILDNVSNAVIGFDEVQFIEQDVVPAIFELMKRNNDIVVAGLDMDYEKNPFQVTMALMARADKVYKLSAICVKCGAEATKTYRKDKSVVDRVAIGGQDMYEARCTNCHELKD